MIVLLMRAIFHNDLFRYRTYFALISGILAVSTGAIFARFADAPALVISAYRVGLAALILSPFALWKCRNELKKLSKIDIAFGTLSGVFLAFHFTVWITSLSYTTVASSVVLVNTNPLWVGLLSPMITGERIKPVVLISIVISLIGVVIISVAGDTYPGGETSLGNLLALAGAIFASLYLMLGRNLRRKLSLLSYVFICYGSAAVLLWSTVLVFNMKISGFSSETLAALWASALIPQLVGHTCYNWALKWFSVNLVAISLLGEPVGSAILAYILFDETLTWQKISGSVLIMLGIYLAAVNEKN